MGEEEDARVLADIAPIRGNNGRCRCARSRWDRVVCALRKNACLEKNFYFGE